MEEQKQPQTLESKQQRKTTYIIKWKVSEWRQDKRVGVVDPPQPRSPYVQMLFDEIDRFFRGDSNENA